MQLRLVLWATALALSSTARADPPRSGGAPLGGAPRGALPSRGAGAGFHGLSERSCERAAASLELEKSAPAAPLVLTGPGLGLVLDGGAAASAACGPSGVASAVLGRAVLDAEVALGVDATLALVVSSAALTCSSLYYVPLANDVRGIGYAHRGGREVFDDTPASNLEGIAFLNDWPYWQAHPEELPSALYHELGHRWGARVHARIGGELSTALLGRDEEHWSYFFSTGGSPLEGNVWSAGAGGYVSETPLYPSQFSALDLYLMGAVTAAEVEAAPLLSPREPPGSAVTDCRGRAPAASSPPQTCGSTAIDAASTLVPLQDIVAAEGPRSPPPDPRPRSIRVLPLVLHSAAGAWSQDSCEAAALALDDALAGFTAATRGRLSLENVLGEGSGCAELSRASGLRSAGGGAAALPADLGCSFARAPRRRSARAWEAWSALALAVLAVRRRLRVSRRGASARRVV